MKFHKIVRSTDLAETQSDSVTVCIHTVGMHCFIEKT